MSSAENSAAPAAGGAGASDPVLPWLDGNFDPRSCAGCHVANLLCCRRAPGWTSNPERLNKSSFGGAVDLPDLSIDPDVNLLTLINGSAKVAKSFYLTLGANWVALDPEGRPLARGQTRLASGEVVPATTFVVVLPPHTLLDLCEIVCADGSEVKDVRGVEIYSHISDLAPGELSPPEPEPPVCVPFPRLHAAEAPGASAPKKKKPSLEDEGVPADLLQESAKDRRRQRKASSLSGASSGASKPKGKPSLNDVLAKRRKARKQNAVPEGDEESLAAEKEPQQEKEEAPEASDPPPKASPEPFMFGLDDDEEDTDFFKQFSSVVSFLDDPLPSLENRAESPPAPAEKPAVSSAAAQEPPGSGSLMRPNDDPMTPDAAEPQLDLCPRLGFPLEPRGGPYLCSQGFGGAFTHFVPQTRHALDFECPVGTPVLAIADGTVVSVEEDVTEGGCHAETLFRWNSILLRLRPESPLAAPRYAEYVHISAKSCRVRPGDQVRRGDVLCLSGDVGLCPRPHLHLQLVDGPGKKARTVPFHLHPTLGLQEASGELDLGNASGFVPRAGAFYSASGRVASAQEGEACAFVGELLSQVIGGAAVEARLRAEKREEDSEKREEAAGELRELRAAAFPEWIGRFVGGFLGAEDCGRLLQQHRDLVGLQIESIRQRLAAQQDSEFGLSLEDEMLLESLAVSAGAAPRGSAAPARKKKKKGNKKKKKKPAAKGHTTQLL